MMRKSYGNFFIAGSESKPSDGGGSEQEINSQNILLKKLLAAHKEGLGLGRYFLENFFIMINLCVIYREHTVFLNLNLLSYYLFNDHYQGNITLGLY